MFSLKKRPVLIRFRSVFRSYRKNTETYQVNFFLVEIQFRNSLKGSIIK